MVINESMDLGALEMEVGYMTRAELEAVREVLARLMCGRQLREVPPLVMQACVNHALLGMPDEVPGEFLR